MKIKTKETEAGGKTMKNISRAFKFFWAGMALLFFLSLPAATVYAGVCSEGTGIPPFLSSGADANLLLLLDNSGSMLDMVYVDNDNRCFDETYEVDFQYAGYFDSLVFYVIPLYADIFRITCKK